MARPIQEVSLEIQPHWNFHEDITIEDGLHLKGTRIIIPRSQMHTLLKKIHAGHPGLSSAYTEQSKLYTDLIGMTRFLILI